jgi:hypothetical protein
MLATVQKEMLNTLFKELLLIAVMLPRDMVMEFSVFMVSITMLIQLAIFMVNRSIIHKSVKIQLLQVATRLLLHLVSVIEYLNL